MSADWFDFANLDLASGKMVLCDLMFWRNWRRENVFSLPSGQYRVSVKQIHHGVAQTNSRLRIMTDANGLLGRPLKRIGIDSAQLAVFDSVAMRTFIRQVDPDLVEATQERMEQVEMYDVFDLNASKAAAAVVRTGFGDGSYPIFELLRNGKAVGLEIVFIGPEVKPEGDAKLVKAICRDGSERHLSTLFKRRVFRASVGNNDHGLVNASLFEDLVIQVPPQHAFRLTPHAVHIAMQQSDPGLFTAALGLAFVLARASDTSEIPTRVDEQWKSLGEKMKSFYPKPNCDELWLDFCRWYRRA